MQIFKAFAGRMLCFIVGHRWKFQAKNECGKVFKCERCGVVYGTNVGRIR
ncbi:hypothetical protein SAMN05421647_103440 [Marinobacterium stanieri]|uniref:Uncharacterized protein n=1 Tax=Marinobacterium stanieri TaxID=49186 RepID=A0A1N6RNN8_9GAMM|nr:hypothetical protein SAMN05421647_103440 [Marinobacterium stanieri]